MKLKTLLQINEWISHGIAVNRTPDSKLRATPGGQNDGAPGWNDGVSDWDGIVEGKDWFCYMEGNDWNTHRSGASIYINEDEQPHKIWIKIKTHGLRKKGDTNESYKEKVRKHTNKVAGSWMKAAKDIHNNPELNEVGNPVQITWKQAFKEALDNPSVKIHLAEKGEQKIAPLADPVNFTPRIGETNQMPVKSCYSAVVLKEDDQHKLLSQFKSQMPEGWKSYAHHMTIHMGKMPDNLVHDIGKEVVLTAYQIGTSDKAIALKVKGYHSNNANPHITLFVNIANGGKPKDSNLITSWRTLSEPIRLHGIVSEIPTGK